MNKYFTVMRRKIFFVVNKYENFDSTIYLDKYLVDVDITFGLNLPDDTEFYDLIILWNYQKILKDVESKNNIVIFHSSDLPNGKGWAPLYYSFYNKMDYYTISCIRAANSVDCGDILVKAQFKILDNYTAEYVREWDNEITIKLISELLEKSCVKKVKGIKQNGIGTFNKRRYPDDNLVSFEAKIMDVFDHLRGCENKHSAFFYFKEEKYIINIKPENIPCFPEDLEIIFYK